MTTTTQLTSIPIAATQALNFYRAFDSLRLLGYSQCTFFEQRSPGATDALRAWAESHGFRLTERTFAATDGTEVRVLSTDLPYPGPTIEVQTEVRT